MAVSIAFLGGRPAMITAATGAVALVIAPVARDYGMDYFIATVLLAGLFQVALGVLGVARLMRFIPRSHAAGALDMVLDGAADVTVAAGAASFAFIS